MGIIDLLRGGASHGRNTRPPVPAATRAAIIEAVEEFGTTQAAAAAQFKCSPRTVARVLARHRSRLAKERADQVAAARGLQTLTAGAIVAITRSHKAPEELSPLLQSLEVLANTPVPILAEAFARAQTSQKTVSRKGAIRRGEPTGRRRRYRPAA